jgi:chaperone modulatory protein CbpM
MPRELLVTREILDERRRFSREDLCGLCGVDSAFMFDQIAEGVLHPEGHDPRFWRFSGTSVKRVQTAIRLQRDLDINLPGVALILDLLEELEGFRRQIRDS